MAVLDYARPISHPNAPFRWVASILIGAVGGAVIASFSYEPALTILVPYWRQFVFTWTNTQDPFFSRLRFTTAAAIAGMVIAIFSMNEKRRFGRPGALAWSCMFTLVFGFGYAAGLIVVRWWMSFELKIISNMTASLAKSAAFPASLGKPMISADVIPICTPVIAGCCLVVLAGALRAYFRPGRAPDALLTLP